MKGNAHNPIEAWLDDELSDSDAVALEAWLRADPANVEAFVRASLLHRRLRDVLCAQSGVESETESGGPKSQGGEWRTAETVASGEWPLASGKGEWGEGSGESAKQRDYPPSAFPLPPPSPSHPSHPSHSPLSPLHSPLFSLETPLGGFLVSYGASTVFVGMLIFIFSLMNSPSQRGEKIVGESATGYASAGGVPRAVPVFEQPEPEIVSIANITGMVDCKWVDKSQAPAYYKIKLHDKFALVSGLMEITYKTGAKVILQGPCTYEVESTDGGYLSLGKLTARVEKKGERGERRGEREAKAEGGGRRAEEAVASGQWLVASEANLPSPSGRGAGGEGGAESADQSALTLALSQRERGPDNPPSALRHPPSPSPQPLAPSPSSVPSPLSPLPSPLFAVRTPTAIVTDLGTEFGVEVEKSGNTVSFVYRGAIQIAKMLPDGKAVGTGVILHANESARVEASAGGISIAAASNGIFARNFVRNMVSVIDVVDIVAGGDGGTHRSEYGIDPTTGCQDTIFYTTVRGGDTQYHRASWHHLIDGVFIPGGQAPMQLDSAGHTFNRFPNTSGLCFGSIWTVDGNDRDSRPAEMTAERRGVCPSVFPLGGIDYAGKGHRVLSMHANMGITFDLDAVRRRWPANEIVRFHAVTGRSLASSVGRPIHAEHPGSADAWVFVDGKLRFSRTNIRAADGAIPADVAIVRTDRFLTLVSTDSGDTIDGDWIIFGDPVLETQPRDP